MHVVPLPSLAAPTIPSFPTLTQALELVRSSQVPTLAGVSPSAAHPRPAWRASCTSPRKTSRWQLFTDAGGCQTGERSLSQCSSQDPG